MSTLKKTADELEGGERFEFAGSEWTIDAAWENHKPMWTVVAKSGRRTMRWHMDFGDYVVVMVEDKEDA